MNAKTSGNAGFTLIEMIVAISILALVAVLGWRGLDGIIRSRAVLSERADATRTLQLTFAQLERDCAELAPPVAEARPPLLVMPNAVLLVRLVSAEQQPTQMQVVAYRLRDGVLIRQASAPTRDLRVLEAAWQAVMTDRGTEALSSVALQRDVAEMRWRAWDARTRTWQSNLDAPKPAGKSGLANWQGLELTLQVRKQRTPFVKAVMLGAA